MPNEEKHIERERAENRRRDMQAYLDDQKAKDNKEKFDKQRKEALKRQHERRVAEENHKAHGSHNLDFSGHEKHGVNEVSAKIHTADLDEEYKRQAAKHFHEHRAEEIDKKQALKNKRIVNQPVSKQLNNEDYQRQANMYFHEHRAEEIEKKQTLKNRRIVNQSVSRQPHNEDYQRQETNHFREQRAEKFEENHALKQRRSDSSYDTGNKSTFSSYGVGKIHTTHIENGTVTCSESKTVSSFTSLSSKSSSRSKNSFYSIPHRNSDYTKRTFNNKDDIRNEYVRTHDLSTSSIRFHYAKQTTKQVMKQAIYTTHRVYSTAGHSVYSISQSGDYGTIHTFEQMRRGAVGTIAAVRIIRNMPHNTIMRTSAIGSYAKTTIINAGRYLKGENTAKLLFEAEKTKNFIGALTLPQMRRYKEIQSQLQKNARNITQSKPLVTLKQVRAEMNRIFTVEQLKELTAEYGTMAKLPLASINKQIHKLNNKKQYGSLNHVQQRKLTQLSELKKLHISALEEHNELTKLSISKINKEIRKLKKFNTLNTAQQIRLDKLIELKSLHIIGGKIRSKLRTRWQLTHSITGIMRQLLTKSESSGIDGIIIATDLATNRYVRTIIREIGKLNRLLMRTATNITGFTVNKIADKTGLTKQANKLRTKAAKKLMNSKPVKTLNKLQQQVNGKAYNAVKKKISAKAPQRLKTMAKKTTSVANKVSKGNGKIASAVKKGFNIVTKPIRAVSKALSMVLKVAKGTLIAACGGFLLLFVIVAAVSTVSSAVSSVILEDVEYLNEYIQILNTEQANFKQTLTSLGSGYKNVTYEYTDGSKMNNTREILCMAAVYLQQDFSDKEKVKTYLRQMFNASHFYSTQESETYYCSDGAGCDNHKIVIVVHADGTRSTRYQCMGHKDLTVTITALAFDEIFNVSTSASGVGDLCFAFETGGQTLGNHDCWYCEDIGDGAGMNYGMMSTNREQATNMWNYIKTNSTMFAGVSLVPFTASFNSWWKGSHSPEETAEMENLQRTWVWNAYGTIWCNDLKSRTGVDMTRSWALKEVALSRAVHRGAYSARSFYSCVNSSMTDEQIIDAIYDHECSTLSSFMSRWNLERNYAKSFLGRIEPTADGDSEQFSWTEDNIEWCKNLYNQDWEELYEGLIGLNSASVGSSMSEAEVEALIGSLDGLSEERKNILSWACSAVGKIPYHWDWRNYWTIDAEDWGTPCTPDYKGRSLKGLDCSGFVVWCYNKAGYDPITCGWGSTGWTGSIADSPKTMRISPSELKPGDIGMTGAYPYTHTGIYAGNGKWIHCTGAPTNNTVCNTYSGFGTYYRMTDLD